METLYWVIFATYAVVSPQLRGNEPHSRLPHQRAVYDQIVKDKQGREVVFNNLKVCQREAAKLMDKMLLNTQIQPMNVRCVPAKVIK